jgi:hypothetical protein
MPKLDQLRRLAKEWEARAENASAQDRPAFARIAELYRSLIEKLGGGRDRSPSDP